MNYKIEIEDLSKGYIIDYEHIPYNKVSRHMRGL